MWSLFFAFVSSFRLSECLGAAFPLGIHNVKDEAEKESTSREDSFWFIVVQ